MLDDFGGQALKEKAAKVAALYERREAVREALSQVTLSEEEKARKMEFLTFQLQEIEAARLQPGKKRNWRGRKSF